MRQVIPPNPENDSLANIELTIRATADRDMANRLAVVRLAIKGHSEEQIADIAMVSTRSVRRYIQLFNGGGIDSLASASRSGRPPLVSEIEEEIILYNLDHPEFVGESHWTLLKLHERIKPVLAHQIGYSTLTRLVRDAGYRRLVPRPESPERDDEKREVFVGDLRQTLKNQNVQVWFMDEAGFLADPRPKAQWAKRGTKPVCPVTGKHIRHSLIGAIQPDTGEFTTLIFSRTNAAVFQVFLDEFDRQTDSQPVVMVLDNASWHHAKCLNWHNIKPLYLPPYSPDLNPIERLWKYIKEHWFAGWYGSSHEELLDRLVEAVTSLFDNPSRVKSVCRVSDRTS